MTTHATGWHQHAGEHEIHYDFKPCAKDDRVPVLVVDPTAACDVIAREIAEHYPTGYTCGETCTHNLNSPQGWAGHLADAVLAALEATP